MAWHTTDSVDEFHRVAGDFLRSRPVEHTVPLTLVDTLRTRGAHYFGVDDPIFGWWQADGRVCGAFLWTPPYPLFVTAAPAVEELAEVLAGHPLRAVNAVAGDTEAFADAWQRRTGADGRPGRRSRLFRLGELTAPPSPAGAPRIAGAADRGRLIAWMAEFHAELGDVTPRDLTELVDDRLSYGGLTLWEVDGSPVSMAGVSRREAGMVRVLSVYTPKEFRGHGYAGAVTSEVSRAALAAGAEHVVLFTDLANPTSNALYQRLGYRPIGDRSVMEFSS